MLEEELKSIEITDKRRIESSLDIERALAVLRLEKGELEKHLEESKFAIEEYKKVISVTNEEKKLLMKELSELRNKFYKNDFYTLNESGIKNKNLNEIELYSDKSPKIVQVEKLDAIQIIDNKPIKSTTAKEKIIENYNNMMRSEIKKKGPTALEKKLESMKMGLSGMKNQS